MKLIVAKVSSPTSGLWRTCSLLLVCSLLAGGCDFLWPTEAPYDPRRCDPRCVAPKTCFEGNCVDAEGKTPALEGTSAPKDTGPADVPPKDTGGHDAPDSASPDLAGDKGQAKDAKADGADGPSTCGNSTIDPGEDCDGSNLGKWTCKAKGFDSGTLSCTKACKLDTTACHKCGDGKTSGNEQCDGADLNNKSCLTLSFYSGTLKCKTDCTFDTSGCSNCGNGVLNGGEQCDGVQFGNHTCKTRGFYGGTLLCKSDCSFDTSSCTNCGNGLLDKGEACDGKSLGSSTCKAKGFDSGNLGCSSNCKAFDTSGCHKCGDGKKSGGEACDGAQLGGATCVTKSFDAGSLGCTKSCTFDMSKCKTWTWKVVTPTVTLKKLEGIWSNSPTNVWIAEEFGSYGKSLVHHDGSAWKRASFQSSMAINKIWGDKAGQVWIVGSDGKTFAHGASGTKGHGPLCPQETYGVSGSTPTNVWVAGFKGCFKRWDGSKWTTISWPAVPGQSTVLFRDVWAYSSKDAWAVGYGGAFGGYIVGSVGGIAKAVDPAPTSSTLHGVWGTSPSDVWAVGAMGVTLRYNGSKWAAVKTNTLQTLYAVWGSSSSSVWAVGANGTVMHHDGKTWSAMTVPTTTHLKAIWGTSDSDIWAVGGSVVLHRQWGRVHDRQASVYRRVAPSVN